MLLLLLWIGWIIYKKGKKGSLLVGFVIALILSLLFLLLISFLTKQDCTNNRTYEDLDSCIKDGAKCAREIESGLFIKIGCFRAGEEYNAFSTKHKGRKCENGLNAILAKKLSATNTASSSSLWSAFSGTCMTPACACMVCANCPNGIYGPGENECNCPEDCKK
ncbi:MAG: hypothetical protein ACTSXL_01255 [Alphaproteobacteria bacterium]